MPKVGRGGTLMIAGAALLGGLTFVVLWVPGVANTIAALLLVPALAGYGVAFANWAGSPGGEQRPFGLRSRPGLLWTLITSFGVGIGLSWAGWSQFKLPPPSVSLAALSQHAEQYDELIIPTDLSEAIPMDSGASAQRLERAIDDMANGAFSQALNRLQQVLLANPASPEVAFLVSWCHYLRGEYDTALQAIGRTLDCLERRMIASNPEWRLAAEHLASLILLDRSDEWALKGAGELNRTARSSAGKVYSSEREHNNSLRAEFAELRIAYAQAKSLGGDGVAQPSLTELERKAAEQDDPILVASMSAFTGRVLLNQHFAAWAKVKESQDVESIEAYRARLLVLREQVRQCQQRYGELGADESHLAVQDTMANEARLLELLARVELTVAELRESDSSPAIEIFEEAAALMETVTTMRQRTLGEAPRTFQAEGSALALRWRLADTDEARRAVAREQSDLAGIARKKLGESHREVRLLHWNSAKMREALGDFEAARAEYESLYEITKKSNLKEQQAEVKQKLVEIEAALKDPGGRSSQPSEAESSGR